MKISLSVFKILWLAGILALPARADEPLRVVTSFYPVYVATLNISAGVPGVEVHSLTSPHIGCLHDYQLTAGDVRQLADADLLLANGAGMETFLGKVKEQSPSLRVVEVSGGIPLMDGNPHVWVSFEGASRQVDNIAEALALAAPEKADTFRANAETYKAALAALDEKMKSSLAPYAGTPIVTFHEAFPYFARDYKLDLVGVIAREPGKVKALFAEPQFADKSAQVISRETGVKVYELDPVVTGPSEPSEARGAYLRAMEKNLGVLQEALR
jgi:zinc transport system substrate-binding protein